MVPNVLITDDDADFRGVLCDALSRRGLHLVQASDGDEALRVIEREPIHMVLVDVHMPKVTGLEVIQVLSERAHRMPYVLMSAMMDEEIEREAARMRAYKILRKPIRLQNLRDIVCGGLAETYGWRPS
ncbi:Response regulator receiver domain-containing protein [Neorhodopirellula lusitana]|uniref:Response regulator receiver domain-containing protein n=1 Tax=Neorhodopirellula lusitana TaxID=445327 RepID=A0ABY1QPA2_9BACT|nr:response regulator [Neorhodopirellula lusitana]SMP76957.1 Response regulator receiver domain-containing protein [Neorhodopirellula lusitana]